MKSFIITSLVLCAIGTLIRFGYLAWHDYPREVNYSRGEDVFMTIVSLVWIGWGCWLLAH